MDTDLNVESEEHNDDVDDENPAAASDNGGRIVLEVTEEESEDEEDVEFNPFLKGSPSGEASSSLSSEVEGLDGDVVVDSHGVEAIPVVEGIGDRVEGLVDDGKVDEETGVSFEAEVDEENGRGGNDTVEEDGVEEQVDRCDVDIRPTIDFDDEDAICKRTRARYSLASFTLDELETFLQETDDEDDFQNVDEEEEYRKFLAAVLKGNDGGGEGVVEGNVEEEDDEDNDADFEIEIEEALESDVDDCIVTPNDHEFERSRWRPKTRQNRRQKEKALDRRKGVQQGERPLRPLVPIMPSALATSIPCVDGQVVTNPSCVRNISSVSGFTEHQIGQLYCLIYEHVQLLVQVYSLCALEPSRQHVASQIKGLLFELLNKRDLVLAWRNLAYPSSCFLPQYIKSLVTVETPQVQTVELSAVSSDRNNSQGCSWLPCVGDNVLSVLDVQPLKLVAKYVIDVSNAVREHQRRCVETTNIYLEKQPLFPRPFCPSEVSSNCISGDNRNLDVTAVSPNDKLPKKTLAATLVENTKNSVALVPARIAKLAEPFYSLFNSALFPHKPPSPAVANRVLFTDSEDVLLAMGMMEYNNDWKAIQQRFLPCKTEHQIFVRSKNRCSSNAPDNPIKAVRKLKTSPLTEDEKASIQEGLQTFKYDWTSIWKFVVPHRDPNLLPRQWRAATGTQKSYKMVSVKKEKHRIYESDRRRKVLAMGNSHSQNVPEKEVNQSLCAGQQNNSGEHRMDSAEAYVHEAFLADWRPNSEGSAASLSSRFPPRVVATERRCELQEEPTKQRSKESESNKTFAVCGSLSSSAGFHLGNFNSSQAYMPTGYLPRVSTSKGFQCQALLNSQRAPKPNASSFVKLSPELPPVKLPPAVRVISQASLRSSHLVRSTVAGGDGHGRGNLVCDTGAANCFSNVEKPVQEITRVSSSGTASITSPNGVFPGSRTDLGPQMHPLLFRTVGEATLPCYSVNSPSTIPTFSFFPALQHQVNVNLLPNPHPGPDTGLKSFGVKEIASTPYGFEFHPLLQRATDFNSNTTNVDSTLSRLNTELELSRDGHVEEILHCAGEDVAVNRPTSPIADTNDLDLDIHLNSASKKRRIATVEGTEINPIVASVSAGNLFGGANKEMHNDRRASCCLAEPMTADSVEDSASDNSAGQFQKMGSSSDCIEDYDKQAPYEIVMEQEELSDSEEEMEDVEFECEEMTDSDGEENLVAAQIVNTKHKGQENITFGTHDKAQFVEQDSCSGGSRPRRTGRPPKSDLARLGKGTEGSWLSLNSRGSQITLQSGAKVSDMSARTPVTSFSNKSSKKAMPSRKRTSVIDKQTTDLSGLEVLLSSSRKSRKPAIKNMSVSSSDVPVVNLKCTEKVGKE